MQRVGSLLALVAGQCQQMRSLLVLAWLPWTCSACLTFSTLCHADDACNASIVQWHEQNTYAPCVCVRACVRVCVQLDGMSRRSSHLGLRCFLQTRCPPSKNWLRS